MEIRPLAQVIQELRAHLVNPPLNLKNAMDDVIQRSNPLRAEVLTVIIEEIADSKNPDVQRLHRELLLLLIQLVQGTQTREQQEAFLQDLKRRIHPTSDPALEI